MCHVDRVGFFIPTMNMATTPLEQMRRHRFHSTLRGWCGQAGGFSPSPHDDKRHRLAYTLEVKTFRWNPRKNELLKACRGVSFEDVVLAIETGGLLDMMEHPNPTRYPHQGVFVVAMSSYVYLVPHVEEAEYVFLKTIIPSRKATREYGMRGKPHERS